jgi:hypothetical protein
MVEKKLPRSAEVKRQCIDPNHKHLSVARQCQLVGLAMSSWYYEPLGESPENLALMLEIDRLYIKLPFFGTRKARKRFRINRKRAQRLMRLMGLEAVCPKRSTSRPAPGHKVYPYLLRNMPITKPDQVWASDITSIPLQHGVLYLTAVMDLYSRNVLSWRLSNTLTGTSAWRLSMQRCHEHGRRSPTRIKEPSSRQQPSRAAWRRGAWPSRWTVAAELSTTCSSNGCGERSSTRRSTCETPHHDGRLSARRAARAARAERRTLGCDRGRQDREPAPVGFRSVPFGGSGGCVFEIGGRQRRDHGRGK